MEINFSEKQNFFVRNSTAKINIADGAVRSGKTFIFNYRWMFYLLHGAKGDLMMVGKTVRTLERNVLFAENGLFDILGGLNVKYKYNRTSGELNIGTRRVYCMGANDEKSEGKIRGMTLAGALCDEVTLYPQSFVKQLLARCSVKGAKLFWNCNPDSPYHYIKTDFIDKLQEKGIVKLFSFTMDDNPALDETYKADLKQMYSGIWYQRMILGLWVLADGVIYSEFDEVRHCITDDELPDKFERYYIGSDYGITNPQVYLKCGLKHVNGQPHFYIVDEYYNQRKDGSKSDPVFLEDYNKFIDEIRVENTIIDPSATSLISLFRQHNISVKAANNAVIDGINNVAAWLKQNRIHIVKSRCPNIIKEFASYIWDEKASKRGEDEPIKENDHALDALRYVIQTLYPVRASRNPVKVRM